jgi:hypothetical protein
MWFCILSRQQQCLYRPDSLLLSRIYLELLEQNVFLISVFSCVSVHNVHDCFVRLTPCPSIHLMNGSWLQHLAMQQLSCLTCESYQEACIHLTTMSMYFPSCYQPAQSVFSLVMLQFSIYDWSVHSTCHLTDMLLLIWLLCCTNLHLQGGGFPGWVES